MANLAFLVEPPVAHLRIVKFRPKLRCVFDCILSGKAKRAPWPAATAGFLLHIEENEMGVRVPDVVAMLVVNCHNIPGDAFGQPFSKCACQSLSLLLCSLHRELNDKSLTDTPLSLLSFFLRHCGRLTSGAARKSFLDHNASSLRPSDIA
nr:hypothetical protein [Shimia isoporae]